jgi:hypothetical protein
MKLKFFLTCALFFVLQNSVFAYSDLIITEVYPNPSTDEKSGEFIELYNPTSNDIDLTNYSIEDDYIKYYNSELPFLLKRNEFVIIHDDEIDLKTTFPGTYNRAVVTNLTARGLANTTDMVVLKKNGNIIDTFEYSQSTEGVSIVRPMPNCSLVTNIAKAAVGEQIVSIGKFDDIFKLPELDLGLEFYNGNSWQNETSFTNLGLLIFRINNHDICPLVSDEFEYSIDTDTAVICGNSIQFDSGKNYDFKLVLKHKLSGSQQIYSIKVNNLVITPVPTPSATPTPLPTIILTPTPGTTITPSPTPTPVPTTTFDNYKEIRINEVYPSPDTGENEWLELYNFGSQNIDLTNWKLTDLSTSQSLTGMTINSKSYLVIEASNLKITLNNAGDEITLKNPAGNIVDSLNYPSIAKSKSYAEIDGVFAIVDIPTKGTINSNETVPTPIPTLTNTPSPTPTPTNTPVPTEEPDNEDCQCPEIVNTLGISSTQAERQIKLPINYVTDTQPTQSVAKEPVQLENNTNSVAKSGGLFLLGIAGFVSTPMGKDLLSILLKKLEFMGA